MCRTQSGQQAPDTVMAGEDPRHLAYLRERPCAIAEGLGTRLECAGPICAHHSTHGRGMSQKAHDHEAMPLCIKHHHDFHAGSGLFRGWTQDQRTRWQAKLVEEYRPKKDPHVF